MWDLLRRLDARGAGLEDLESLTGSLGREETQRRLVTHAVRMSCRNGYYGRDLTLAAEAHSDNMQLLRDQQLSQQIESLLGARGDRAEIAPLPPVVEDTEGAPGQRVEYRPRAEQRRSDLRPASAHERHSARVFVASVERPQSASRSRVEAGAGPQGVKPQGGRARPQSANAWYGPRQSSSTI